MAHVAVGAVQVPGASERSVTIILNQEDHTLGNSLRYMLMRK
jgi:DNA-directed RNA polymerase subunit L